MSSGPDNLTRWAINRLKDQLHSEIGKALERAYEQIVRGGADALARSVTSFESEAVQKAKDLVSGAASRATKILHKFF